MPIWSQCPAYITRGTPSVDRWVFDAFDFGEPASGPADAIKFPCTSMRTSATGSMYRRLSRWIVSSNPDGDGVAKASKKYFRASGVIASAVGALVDGMRGVQRVGDDLSGGTNAAWRNQTSRTAAIFEAMGHHVAATRSVGRLTVDGGNLKTRNTGTRISNGLKVRTGLIRKQLPVTRRFCAMGGPTQGGILGLFRTIKHFDLRNGDRDAFRGPWRKPVCVGEFGTATAVSTS